MHAQDIESRNLTGLDEPCVKELNFTNGHLLEQGLRLFKAAQIGSAVYFAVGFVPRELLEYLNNHRHFDLLAHTAFIFAEFAMHENQTGQPCIGNTYEHRVFYKMYHENGTKFYISNKQSV